MILLNIPAADDERKIERYSKRYSKALTVQVLPAGQMDRSKTTWQTLPASETTTTSKTWQGRQDTTSAVIVEKQRESAGRSQGLNPAIVQEVDAFVERLEIMTGLDIDGDGQQGNDARTKVEGHEKKEEEGPTLKEDEVMVAEQWTTRLNAVEENLKEIRAVEHAAKAHIVTAAKRNSVRRNASKEEREDANFDPYHQAVQHTVENRAHVWVTGKTHGALFITLQNLADGIKKSAQQARNETPGGMSPEQFHDNLKNVHKLQVRSFVAGGQVMWVKGFCPNIFCKIRNHFGLSYEAFIRLADVAVEGLWQSGDYFFSSKSGICYKRIKAEERKSIIDMLTEYDKHMTLHPFSLIPQW